MQEISLRKKIASYLVRFTGIFLALYSILALIIFYEFLVIAKDQGRLEISDDDSHTDSISIITDIVEGSETKAMGIAIGDTITHVNGLRLGTETNRIGRIIGVPRVGDNVTLTIKRSGQPVDYKVPIINMPIYDKILETLFRTIPVFIMIGFIIAGLWGSFKNPYSTESLLISMFCFCFGSFMYSSIQFSVIIENIITRSLFFYNIKSYLNIFAVLAPSFWLYLFMIFPKKFSFFEKNKFLSFLVIFFIPIIVLASIIFQLTVSFIIIFILISLYMALGVILLGFNLRKTNNALERRQIKLVLLGVKYGSISILIGWVTYILAYNFFENVTTINWISLTVLLAGETGGLIIPLTFINSFAKNKLLETEGALRKRVRYVLFTTLLLIVYLSIIFLFGRASISILNLTDPTFVIIFVLFLSLTFTPINKKLLNWVDERFYPERTRYITSFRNFIQTLPGHIDPDEVMDSLKSWISDTLKIDPIIPLTLQQNGKKLPFDPANNSSIINKVKNGNKFFWDEISDKNIINISRDEMRWARENDISMTIPMIAHGEVMGLLNIGKKTGKEDYSSDDLDILTQASDQTAFTLRNLKLQQEYIQKKRMDKELDMARRIQRQLLPQTQPVIKGLQCYGHSLPCFEVAGDYYDIINMEDGNTVIVIADVSGKGAGAALIMANLQASIRLGIHLSDSLSDFVSRINELIYSNTSDTEFVTFFMGIWVPGENAFYYVNAGQNPPIIYKRDGNIKMLNATGLILGILHDQKYETGKLILEEGDVGLIYTDGLDEALSPSGELFGTERVLNLLKEHRHGSPEEIEKQIMQAILEFSEGEPFHDDVTMIVIKK